MLAYSDESGTPGTALHSNDWFLVAMIFFRTKTARDEAKRKVKNLRKKLELPEDYEFHHIEDSKNIQTAFYATIADMDFTYKVFIVKKTIDKKFCSEPSIAKYVLKELADSEKISIIMDKNPKLYAKYCKAKKLYNVKNINIKESDSCRDDCLQIVDYIASYEMARIRQKRIRRSMALKLVESKKVMTKLYIKDI